MATESYKLVMCWLNRESFPTKPLFLTRIMPESVRWLVSQGRKDEAVKIIKKAAKVNGVEVPKHLLEDTNLEVICL